MRVAVSELVNVALQVLLGYGVISPVNRPLHLRPEALYDVRVYVSSGVSCFENKGLSLVFTLPCFQKVVHYQCSPRSNLNSSLKRNDV